MAPRSSRTTSHSQAACCWGAGCKRFWARVPAIGVWLAASWPELTNQPAQAVHLVSTDVGFAIRGVALALGLDFLPLERFDLPVPDDLRDDPRMLRLLDTQASGSFRSELEQLGYEAGVSADKSRTSSSSSPDLSAGTFRCRRKLAPCCVLAFKAGGMSSCANARCKSGCQLPRSAMCRR